MLVAPERDAIAIIGVGQIWGIPLAGTWLYTPSVDGQHLWYTTDNQSGIEIDISRCWKSQLVRVTRFEKLWKKHCDWVQALGVIPQRFRFQHEVAEFRRFREEHYREMSRRGLISFAKDSELYWRYTVFGAVKAAILNSSVGLLRAITFGRIPRSA
jgi:uncharacterized protein YeaO (DUF488 family)